MHTFFSISALATSVAAISIALAPNFAIVAKLPSSSPLIAAEDWNLTSYHIAPCYDYAVFTDGPGRTFYVNGTNEDLSSHTSTIASLGGTPPWPWGFVVNPANATDDQGRRNVYINCGNGTPGVEASNKVRIPDVTYGTGDFYVCNSTLLYGPAIALYYREAEEQTPGGCSDVQLQLQCVDDESMQEFQHDARCLKE